MQVNPGMHEDYGRSHPIWPDLEGVLKSQAVHNHSLVLQSETDQVFAPVEVEDDGRGQSIAHTEVCRGKADARGLPPRLGRGGLLCG